MFINVPIHIQVIVLRLCYDDKNITLFSSSGLPHLLDLVNQVENDLVSQDGINSQDDIVPQNDESHDSTFVMHSPLGLLSVNDLTPPRQTSRAYIDQDTGSYVNDQDNDDQDELEESQVLEDIFFIK